MSFIRQTIAIGALSALAAAQGTTPPKLDAACADVVIFMARGNDAPYHDGRTFPFVDATCSKLTAQGKTCDYIDIEFDATYGGDYCTQVAGGARNGVSQITAFNQKCPCTHIVVNGYSEGSHVVGDTLGGPGGCTFVSTGIDRASSAGTAIAAALLWGDPMHTANQPYNVLDGAGKQSNGRSVDDLARLNRYESVLRSYCAAGDPVCAGGDVTAEHLNYFDLYTDDASSWVVSKIAGTAPLCSTSSSSSSAPASSTPASSSTAESSSSPSATDVASTAEPSESSAPGSITAAALPTAVYPTKVPTTTVAPWSSAAPSSFPVYEEHEQACVVVYDVEYKYE